MISLAKMPRANVAVNVKPRPVRERGFFAVCA
jgi:hypothetical protein